MSLLVRDSKTVDGNVASRNPWAEAFNNLDPDEQKRFNQADNDLLGILKMVSKDRSINNKLDYGWHNSHLTSVFHSDPKRYGKQQKAMSREGLGGLSQQKRGRSQASACVRKNFSLGYRNH